MVGYAISEIGPQTATAFTDSGATETIVLTMSNVNTGGIGGTVTIIGMVNITTGTATTAVVVTVRRGGTITSPIVGAAITVPAAATTKYAIPFEVVDNNLSEAGAVYTVDVTETSATGNGTVNYASVGGFTN